MLWMWNTIWYCDRIRVNFMSFNHTAWSVQDYNENKNLVCQEPLSVSVSFGCLICRIFSPWNILMTNKEKKNIWKAKYSYQKTNWYVKRRLRLRLGNLPNQLQSSTSKITLSHQHSLKLGNMWRNVSWRVSHTSHSQKNRKDLDIWKVCERN